MIIDLLKFTAKSECLEDVIKHMKTQTSENRGDEGCVLSHVFQSQTNPDELYMLLGWESLEAVEKHLATPHDAAFRANIDDKIAAPPEFVQWTMLI